MLENKQFYEIRLEDYYYPRYASVTKPYYGTMEDIINLMVRLSDNKWTAKRYQETIEAAEYYDLDDQVTHTVAGQVLPLLIPVQEICCYETTLSNHRWSYTTYNGSVIPCCAEKIYIRQTLFQTPNGYERCLVANILKLSVCPHYPGWCHPNGVLKGFPGIVTWSSPHTHTMHLFASQAHYATDQLETAKEDLVNPDCIDLSVIMSEIFAEG